MRRGKGCQPVLSGLKLARGVEECRNEEGLSVWSDQDANSSARSVLGKGHRRDRFSKACSRATHKKREFKVHMRHEQPAGPVPGRLRSLAFGRNGPLGNADLGRGPRRSRFLCDLLFGSGPLPCFCIDGPHNPLESLQQCAMHLVGYLALR